MAFSHGKSAIVYVNGRDLTGYFKKFSVSGTADVADATTFGDTSKDYVAGQTDATLTAEGLFDGTTSAIADILSTALGDATSSVWTWFPAGASAIGNDGYGLYGIETSYEVDSPINGVVGIAAEVQGTVGLEPVDLLHVLALTSTTANGSSLDGAAGTTGGGAAYLHATAVAGTNPTAAVTVEHSTDDSAWSTLATFTTVSTAGTSQRVAVSGTVNRYLRVAYTIGGSVSPSVTFTVAFNRK